MGIISDLHLGLRVEDMERTPEIEKALNFAVDAAIAREVRAFLINGDLTHTSSPPYSLLAILIAAIARLVDAGIEVWIVRGNHEALANDDLWALTPLERAGFKNVRFIKRPTSFRVPGGPHVFTFLPHAVKREAKAAGHSSVQHWYSATVKKGIEAAQASGGKVTVFSHTNVKGARAGTENLMVRQSDLQVPAVCFDSDDVTQVFSGHVHTPQEVGKVFIIGSPVCTDFGDVSPDRGFVFANLLDDGTWEKERVRTPQAPLAELRFEILEGETNEGFIADFQAALTNEPVTAETILKVKIRVDEDRAPEFDFEWAKKEAAARALVLRDFEVTRVKQRRARDPKIRSQMPPREAVERFLARSKPDGAERKLALALKILEEGKHAASVAPAAVSLVHDSVGDDYLSRVEADLLADAEAAGLQGIEVDL